MLGHFSKFKDNVTKLNPSLALTLVMLAMLLGTSCVSAYVGSLLGSVAIEGVTQPDVDLDQQAPTETDEKPKTTSKNKGLVVLDEKEIIANVYDRIKNSKSKPENSETKLVADKETATRSEGENALDASNRPEQFPIQNKVEGITLEVAKVSKEENSLLLDINMKNEGSQTVKFLYSFLELRDDQNRPLSAITDGLPAELPANKENFSGTVKIPATLLENAQTISLSLADYPEQKIQLKLSDIPVVK
jgi:hypothetical protein